MVHEAIASFDSALGLNPNNLDAWTGKATAFFFIGDYVNALFYVNQALQINPNNKVDLAIKLGSLFNLGDFNQTLFTADRILDLDHFNISD